MEIVVGIVIVFVILIVIGKIKGAPNPSSMSDAALVGRLQTENAWVSRYLRLPYENQQSDSLKKMYAEKTEYIKQIEQEIIKRQTAYQLAQGEAAITSELAPILERTQALMSEGKAEPEATAFALKEWHEKNK